MTSFVPKKTLTQEEYDATKIYLEPTEIVTISDAVFPQAPLAVGSVQLISEGGGDAPAAATYLTGTDETSTLPNSIDLGSLGTSDAQNLLINTPTGGEAVLSAVELTANSILTVDPTGELESTALTANSILTGGATAEFSAWVPGNSKVLTTNNMGVPTATDMAAYSFFATTSGGAPNFPTLVQNSFLTSQGSPAQLNQYAPGNYKILTTSATGVPESVSFTANTMLYCNNGNALLSSSNILIEAAFALGTQGAGNTYSISSGDALTITAPSGTMTSADYTFRTSMGGSSISMDDGVGFTVTTTSSEDFDVDTTAGGNFKLTGLASGTGTALVVDGSNNVLLDSSSIRYKHDIKDLEIDTSKIYDLKPKSFRFNVTNMLSFGLIAEEVNEILPELVVKNKQNQIESVMYNRLPILLLCELKKLRKELDELKSKL